MKIFGYKTIRTLLLTIAATLFFSCEQREIFTIEGTIKGGEGKILYFTNIGTNRTSIIDSVKIKKDERFRFSHQRPECYDFYALHLKDGGRRITLAIDSTEVITINTTAAAFADSCRLEGSPESVRLKEIITLEASLQQQVNALIKDTAQPAEDRRSIIYNLIGDFKKNIFEQYIKTAPHKASAYYALFLRLNGEPIFSPTTNRFDSRCFAAVATGLNSINPHATRAIHLHNIATKGLSATRPAEPKDTIDINGERVEKIGLYNIELPNINGDTVSLRSLKGKVVILDFTVYGIAEISSRNIGLRDIYRKYHDRGLEIYQVSFDEDESFWNNSADNLPWICVRDGEGQASRNLLLYNITELPTFYLINKNNELVYRDNQIEDIDKAIENLLKE